MSKISSLVNRFNLVKQIPIFDELNWIDLQKIARKVVVSEYKKGDIISKEGTPADFFYCLISGRVQSYTLSSAQKKENVDFIHRGMHFGIISILTGEQHSMTFEAINDSIILKIPRKDFQAILKAIPQLSLRLSQSLSRRIRRKVQGGKSTFESTVISVYSPTKGTGSSTYAVNLALSLKEETGKKTILVNIQSKQEETLKPVANTMDPSPHWLKKAVDLGEIVDDQEKILNSIHTTDLKIDLLNVAFNPAESSLKDQIGLFVSAFVGDYHYVIVDLPNEMDDLVIETLTQSDLVHLITFDRKRDLEMIRKVIDKLEVTLQGKFHEDKIRVIVRAVHAKIFLSFEDISTFIDYPIYMALPAILPEELSKEAVSEYIQFLKPNHRSDYHKAITHVARRIGGVSVGLVLGGGAALGVAHIGVIRVLEEEDIPIDIVVGSSMGALVAAMWATGNNAKELEGISRDFEKKRSLIKLFDPVLPISGLIKGQKITRWLTKYLGNRTFYGTRIPLKIIAYDLVRREEIVIESGSIVEAVRKSVAIPGVIEPIQEKDQLIIDGGVLNPLPTNILASRGIKKIIAVNVLQSPDDVSTGFDLLKQQEAEKAGIPFTKAPFHYVFFRLGRFLSKPFSHNISDIIVRTLQASEHVIAEQSAQQADVNIHPDLVGINWFELYKVDELIKRGENAARQNLEAIKNLIER